MMRNTPIIRACRATLTLGVPLAFTLGVSACGTLGLGRTPPPDNERFTTDITTGGLKFFVYEWGPVEGEQREDYRHYSPPAREAVGREPRQPRQPRRFVPHHRESFEYALEQKIQQTGYCRDGYYILSRHFIPGESRLRGECKDLATREDRQRFGETSPN